MLSTVTLTNKRGFDEIEIIEEDKTARFRRNLKGDFASQRNFALSKAKGDWVLFIDSDEKLSPEIISIPQGFAAFSLKRLDHFFGKTLHHGETGNIRLVRLAKKNFDHWEGKVHEVWVGQGKVGLLRNYLEHYPHPTIREFITEINSYTTIRAQELNQFEILELLKPPAKFITNYFFKLGFLDGMAGFVMAYMMSLHSLIVRVKLYEKQIN